MRTALARPPRLLSHWRSRSFPLPAASSTPPSRCVLGVATGMITRLGTHVGASDATAQRASRGRHRPRRCPDVRGGCAPDARDQDVRATRPSRARAPRARRLVPPRGSSNPRARALPMKAASRPPNTFRGTPHLRAPPPPNASPSRRRPPRPLLLAVLPSHPRTSTPPRDPPPLPDDPPLPNAAVAPMPPSTSSVPRGSPGPARAMDRPPARGGQRVGRRRLFQEGRRGRGTVEWFSRAPRKHPRWLRISKSSSGDPRR